MKRWSFNSIEDLLLQAILVGAVATSIILSAIGIDVKWYIPAIFAVLYIIYRQISDLSDRTAAGVESTFYGSNSYFYSSSQRRMQSAKTHIWVTYVRLVPPPGFESAEA